MANALTAEPAEPRRRGRPRALTEAQIVEAVLRLSRDVGFDELSMRRLARELGVQVMTIYNYVPNKRALFDLVSDHLLRSVAVPAVDAGNWQARMRSLQRDARTAVAEHLGFRMGAAIGQSQEAARLADGVMAILADGGFTPEEAELAFATLFTLMLGQIELDAIARDWPDDLSASIAPASARDEVFDFALDVVLEGLRLRFGKPPEVDSE